MQKLSEQLLVIYQPPHFNDWALATVKSAEVSGVLDLRNDRTYAVEDNEKLETIEIGFAIPANPDLVYPVPISITMGGGRPSQPISRWHTASAW